MKEMLFLCICSGEALRTHGVPARYAEGYYVSDTDFQKARMAALQ